METQARRFRVLIMDDDSLTRAFLHELMVKLGYEATIVAETRDAIRIFEAKLHQGIRFDLVILDLLMPGNMSGLDVFMHLRGLDPKTRAMLISGCTFNGVMERFQEYGFVAKLEKPFTLDSFALAVEIALQTS